MKLSILIAIGGLLTSVAWAEFRIIPTGTDLLKGVADEVDPFEPDQKVPVPQAVPNPIADVLDGGVLDLRPWLEHKGCKFEDQDIALFHAQRGLVILRAKPLTIDLVEQLVEGSPPPPMNLRFILKLVQQTGGEQNELCRVEGLTRSGSKVTGGSPECTYDLEPTLGLDNTILDSRIVFTGRAGLEGIAVCTAVSLQVSKAVEVASWSTIGESRKVLTCKVERLPVLDWHLTDEGLRDLTSKVAEILGK